MSSSAETIERLQSYLDDYGHTYKAREQFGLIAGESSMRQWRWKRQQVKSTVAHAQRCGVIPTGIAWWLVKIAVEAFIRRYLFGATK